MNTVNSYNVSVVAIGNANSLIIDSNTTSLTQKVSQLETPVITAIYDKEQVSENGSIVVNINDAIAHHNGYSYAFSGTKKEDYESAEGTCSVKTDVAGKYTVTAMARGGLFDDNGIFYCDSKTSDAKTITLLSAPTESTIEKTTDNVINWQAISSASRYRIVITYTDGTESGVIESQFVSYNDNSGKTVASVSVTAIGNGKTTITSKTVTRIFNV